MKIPQKKVVEFLRLKGDSVAVLGDSKDNRLTEKATVIGSLIEDDFDVFSKSIRQKADKMLAKVTIKVVVLIEK